LKLVKIGAISGAERVAAAVAGHKGATVAADNIYNIRYRVHVKKPQGFADLV